MATDTTLALETLANIKTYLQITGTGEDTILETLIDLVSSAMNLYTGRHLLAKAHTEYYSGDGSDELILRNYPVTAVSSLYNADDNRAFDSTTQITVADDVIIVKDKGILKLWNHESAFLKGKANVKVTYTSGYGVVTNPATVPHDLRFALKRWVAQVYMRYQRKRFDIQSESVGDHTVTFVNEEMPVEVKAILDKYVSYFGAPGFEYAD